MISNTTDVRGEFTMQINYQGDNHYVTGIVRLDPGETKTFDLRKLRDDQTPDVFGRPLPRDLTIAQARWRVRGNTRLNGRSEVVSIKDSVSSSYSCFLCCPNTFASGWLTPDTTLVLTGGTQQFTALEQDSNGAYCGGTPQAYPVSGFWYSSEEAVATVSNFDEGLATGISPGNADISCEWTVYYWVWNDFNESCDMTVANFEDERPMEVVQISKIQYQGDSGFVDVGGTLYVLKDSSVTFKAIPTSSSFPSNKPVWSGTAGATGTGQTKSVTFSTASSSSSDYKTVIATAGNAVTVNVIVIQLTGQLTPDDNFSGRSATSFGVHEHVTLGATIAPSGVTASTVGGMQWVQTTGSGTISAQTDGTGTYDAADSAQSVVLKLKMLAGPSKNGGPTSNLTVVAPSSGSVTSVGGIKHFQNWWSCGFIGDLYVSPATVSFANLYFIEDDVNATGTGWLAFLNGIGHNPGSALRLGFGNASTGSRVVSGGDQIFSGKYRSAEHGAYATGSVSWAIPWKYSIDGTSWSSITTVTQTASSTSTGKCTISKDSSGSFSKELTDAGKAAG